MRHIFSALSKASIGQVLNSGSNFLFTLIIARQFSMNEFGVYGVWFSLSILLAGIGNSIVHTQVAVNYFSKQNFEKDEYVVRMFLGLVGISLVLVAFYGISCGLFYILGFDGDDFYGLGLCSCVVMVCFSLKDYCVRVAYTKQNHGLVVKLNFISAFVLVLLGILFFKFDFLKNAKWGLVFYGLSNFVPVLYFLFVDNFDFRNTSLSNVLSDLYEAWRTGGKWFLLVTFATAIQSQFYTFVVAGFLGVEEVASMNIVKILFMLPIVMIPVVNQVYLPRFINEKKLDKGLYSSFALSRYLVLGAIAYSLLMWLFSDRFLSYLLKYKTDSNIDFYILAWSVSVVTMASKVGFTIENHANKDFKKLFELTLLSGIIALLFSYPLMNYSGGAGAVFALSIGDATLCYLLYRNYKLNRTKI